ncbi:hypothetical protein D3C86_1808840 [compost metagenome]
MLAVVECHFETAEQFATDITLPLGSGPDFRTECDTVGKRGYDVIQLETAQPHFIDTAQVAINNPVQTPAQLRADHLFR